MSAVNKSDWKPAHEAHAIERVSATFQFKEAVPTKRWHTLVNSASSKLAQDFGFGHSFETVEFNVPSIVGQQVVWQGGPSPAPTGRAFQIIQGAEWLEEVNLQRTRFVYSATRYTRWQAFRTRTSGILSQYLKLALEDVDLALVKLEYWDRFVFDGKATEANYETLFNANSKYVSQFALSAPDLWHSHVGYFVPAPTGKRLVNLNIDLIDLNESNLLPGSEVTTRRSAGLYSMVQNTIELQFEALEDVYADMDRLHTMLIDIMRDVVTPQVAKQISLSPEA